eukprot:CAMPEP_0117456002 /NCGR_PEP_ID=MMETSP0759-20121206/11652_1 /TAXON_ID=63605 /ORGANISM="Percolomonas cosmopolitus, Strain WS" /LENGTH=908 /DNA_ID=CAMNT_0005249327 /DNA_START=33 /DNA_END=2759 /DNA_ORIENTATION=-
MPAPSNTAKMRRLRHSIDTYRTKLDTISDEMRSEERMLEELQKQKAICEDELNKKMPQLRSLCVPVFHRQFGNGLIGIQARSSAVASALQMLCQLSLLRDHLFALSDPAVAASSTHTPPLGTNPSRPMTSRLKSFMTDAWKDKYSCCEPIEIETMLKVYGRRYSTLDLNDSGSVLDAMLSIMHQEEHTSQSTPTTDHMSDADPSAAHHVDQPQNNDILENVDNATAASEAYWNNFFQNNNNSFFMQHFGVCCEWESKCTRCSKSTLCFNQNFSIKSSIFVPPKMTKIVATYCGDTHPELRKYGVILEEKSTFADLKKALREQILEEHIREGNTTFDVNLSTLLIAEEYNAKIREIFSDDDSIERILNPERVMVYEVPELEQHTDPSEAPLITFVLAYLVDNKRDVYTIPFIRYFQESSTNKELYDFALLFLRRFKNHADMPDPTFIVKVPSGDDSIGDHNSNGDLSDDDALPTKQQLVLAEFEMYMDNMYDARPLFLRVNDEPTPINNFDNDPYHTYQRRHTPPTFHIWIPDIHAFEKVYKHPMNMEHERIEETVSAQEPFNVDRQTTLYDCLEETLSPKRINRHCDTCGSQQQTISTLKIIKSPKYAIIRLNRFTQNADHRRVKNSHYVHFPLENLKLNDICKHTDNEAYHLTATGKMFGGSETMNWLHFTTCARFHKKASEFYWYLMDELLIQSAPASQIRSSDTLVLVYESGEEIKENAWEDVRKQKESKQSPEDVEIHVRLNRNGKCALMVNPQSELVGDLKRKLALLEKIDPEHFFLGFDGEQLEEDRSLEHYGIGERDELFLNHVPPHRTMIISLTEGMIVREGMKAKNPNSDIRIELRKNRSADVTSLQDKLIEMYPTRRELISKMRFFLPPSTTLKPHCSLTDHYGIGKEEVSRVLFLGP